MAEHTPWHAIMAAVEGPTGTWRMATPDGREYGRVEIRRAMNGGVQYKAIWRSEVLGGATALRGACEREHQAFVRSHRPSGPPAADWANSTATVCSDRGGRRNAPSPPKCKRGR